MATLLLGNADALDNGAPLPGRRITTVHVPDRAVDEVLRTLFDPNGLWAAHSAARYPAWVECGDEVLADAVSIAADCPIGRPADWEG